MAQCIFDAVFGQCESAITMLQYDKMVCFKTTTVGFIVLHIDLLLSNLTFDHYWIFIVST